jgi:hypothetical protein
MPRSQPLIHNLHNYQLLLWFKFFKGIAKILPCSRLTEQHSGKYFIRYWQSSGKSCCWVVIYSLENIRNTLQVEYICQRVSHTPWLFAKKGLWSSCESELKNLKNICKRVAPLTKIKGKKSLFCTTCKDCMPQEIYQLRQVVDFIQMFLNQCRQFQ